MKPTVVASMLCLSALLSPAVSAQEDRPIKALLVIGGCCHDYKAQQKLITEGVSARANVEWTIAYDPDTGTSHKNPVYENPDWAKGFDVVVHDECSAGVVDVPFIEQRILKPHREGLPAVVLHCGEHCYRSEGFPKDTPWFQFTGVGSTGHGAQLPIEVSYVDKEHPVTKGFADWTTINEELYNNVRLYDTAHPLARGKQKVKNRRGEEHTDDFVVAWTNLYQGKTRVFATTLGHNNETVRDAKYMDLVTRGLLWSVDKLDGRHLKPAKKVLSQAPAAGAGAGDSKENLALGKTATASSVQDDSRSARAAVDGDDTSRWCAANDTAPQWLRVDLGRPEELTGARVRWEFDDQKYAYKLEGSADDKSWSVLVDHTAKPGAATNDPEKFSARSVRYVRLTVTGLNPGAWASLYELEIFGTRPATASAGPAPDARQAAAKRIAASLHAPTGYDLTVFAAPPDVNYPTAVAATPGGELFVGIDEMGSLGKEAGHGRVVRCVDRDGDGVADEFKTFAKMDHPRGLVWDDSTRTLYVQHPPFLSAYTDDDGDGVADRSQVLVKGTTNERTQGERGADHTTNGIRLGIDGWIYIAMGDFGCTGAVGKDGTKLTKHGGGVVRVRTDGSGLEEYTVGQRNIYDVAIDPLMNAFTRDNTNDGDGWDVRLSYIVPAGNYGYPRLFKNFPDEIVKPMLDLGGGSPCGSLFVQELGLPPGDGNTLFAVEWGRNAIMRHPLTPSGAGFEAKEQKWMDLPRGTDLDVDAQGRFYASSWAGGGFSYSGPNVGYVIRLSPKSRAPAAAPELNKATDDELVTKHLASPGAVTRLAAQREILKRGGERFAAALNKLATSDAPIEARVAALFTLAQSGADAAPLAARDDLREFALRAMADREAVPADRVKLYTQALEDRNPRVRLQAAWGLGRVGGAREVGALVRHVADQDPLVAHVAVNSLVTLRAYDACAKALDSSTAQLVPGAARAMQAMHETRVVELLADKLRTQQDPAVRAAVYRALCRLAYREADWDGGWWGTRPDTSGPYYKPVEWEGTAKAKEVLRAALASEQPAMLRTLVVELKRHKVDLPEAAPVVARLAATDASFRQVLVDLLASKPQLSPDDVSLVTPIARSSNEPEPLRAKAVRLLARKDDEASLATVVEVLAPIAAAEPGAGELASALNDFTRDQRWARRTDYFAKLASSDDPAKRDLAYAVLVNLATARGEQRVQRSRTAARSAVDAAWADEGRAVSALHAIGLARAKEFGDKVTGLHSDPRPAVAQAASVTAQRLGLGAPSSGPTILSLGFDRTLAAVTTAPGEAKKGVELFSRLGCVNCHTTSRSEPPKGPPLAEVATKYSRAELCESVLKPSARIAQGFETQWFKPKSGDLVEGFVTSESGDTIELRNVQGQTMVLKKDAIQRRGTRDFSTMPEGLASNLTPDELADLLAYVESLKGK